jgi:hypothetical protein
MIVEIDHLISSISAESLSYELKSVREEWHSIRVARDQGIALNKSNYDRSFDDAFHNPMLDFYAPIYYDLETGKKPSSLTEIRDLLQYQRDLSS